MTYRPFALNCLVSYQPRVLSVELRFGGSSAIEPEITELAARYMQTFADAVSLGAFATDSLNSQLIIDSHHVFDNVLRWTLTGQCLHAVAALALVNMFHCFHSHVRTIENLTIHSDIFSRHQFENLILFKSDNNFPFNLDFDADGPDVIVDLEFDRPPPATAVKRYVRAWNTWVDLAQFGAFADDNFPPDRNEIYEAMEPTLFDDSLQFAVESAYLAPECFDALAQMFCRLHAEVAPLRQCSFS